MKIPYRYLFVALLFAGACTSRHVAVLDEAGARLLPCRALTDDAGQALAVDLRWHARDEAADQAALSEACAVVGPVTYLPAERPNAAVTMAIDDVAIVSWNVHVGGGDLASFVSRLRAGDLTGGVPPREFVVLVQEAFRGGPAVPSTIPRGASVPDRIAPTPPSGTRRDVIDIARALGLSVFYVPSMRNGEETGADSEDRGNAILSTLPLTDLAAIELPYQRQRRVAAVATIAGVDDTAGRWQLRVVSLHLDASTGAAQLWMLSSALRERQARYLVDTLDDDATPTVVGSDLNTWAGGTREPAYAVMRSGFPQTGASAGATFGNWLTLDYLFFRLPPAWQGESETAAADFGSDHKPIVGRIRTASQKLRTENSELRTEEPVRFLSSKF